MALRQGLDKTSTRQAEPECEQLPTFLSHFFFNFYPQIHTDLHRFSLLKKSVVILLICGLLFLETYVAQSFGSLFERIFILTKVVTVSLGIPKFHIFIDSEDYTILRKMSVLA